MPYYLDETEVKYEKVYKGKQVKLVRCGCAVCEKCWFIDAAGHCIYGGPFAGFEEDDAVERETAEITESETGT